MTHTHSSFPAPPPEWHEQRLIFQADSEALKNLYENRDDIEATGESFEEWREKAKGADELFDYFSTQPLDEINRQTLNQYLKKNTDLAKKYPKGIQVQLSKAFAVVNDAEEDAGDRLDADGKIETIIDYLKKRNEILQESKKMLSRIKDPDAMPNMTEDMISTAKEHVGKFAEGFMDAEMKDKAMMVVGVIAALLVYRKFTPKPVKNLAANTLGVVLGTAAAVAGYQSFNKVFEKSYGRPLLSNKSGELKTPSIGQSQQAWELDRVWGDLKSQNIPVDQFDDIKHHEKQRFSFGIANLTGMNAKEFQDLYEAHKDSGKIPNDATLYPTSPFRDDLLTPIERFVLVKDMGEALKLIEETSGEIEDISVDQEKQSVLHFAMERWEEEEAS